MTPFPLEGFPSTKWQIMGIIGGGDSGFPGGMLQYFNNTYIYVKIAIKN